MESEPPNSGLLSLSGLFLFFPLVNLIHIGGFFILILLVICSALISGSEVAYFSLSPNDEKDLEDEDSPKSKRILKLINNPQKLLATILIGNNFINILIIIVSGVLINAVLPLSTLSTLGEACKNTFPFGSLWDWPAIISFLITIVGVTCILVLFGEIAPKIYANLNNLRLAKFMSGPINVLSSLFAPISGILVGMSAGLEKRLEEKANAGGNTKEDIDSAIDLAVRQDASTEQEVDMLKGIVKFNEVMVRQIMKSRVDILAVEQEINFEELMQFIKSSAYSRIPVFKEDLDNIVGILYVKDLVGYYHEHKDFNWQEKVRTNTLFVPETKKIDDLLQTFQQKRQHMAIVVDEYGGTQGVVTLEDVIEEVTGDIKDEFNFQKVNKNTYIFEGKILLNDACRIMDLEIKDFDEARGESDSLAGLLLEISGQLPVKDQIVEYNNYHFKILSVSKRRIEKVQVKILEKDLNA